MIRILLVDDHEIFTHSLARLLDARVDIQIVGTTDSAAGAAASVEALRPDVVLMDFHLPDEDGPAATRRIRALDPDARVIMLTARTDESALVAAIDAGCAGFVRKEDGVRDLLDAIVAACDDEIINRPADLSPLLRQLAPLPEGSCDLTPREIEILTLSAAGMVNKEVAGALGIRLNTVRNHVQRILTKLGAHSRLEAVAIAVRSGIISYPVAAWGGEDPPGRERAIDPAP